MHKRTLVFSFLLLFSFGGAAQVTQVDGTNADIILNGSESGHSSAGALIKPDSTKPSAVVKLGSSSSSSGFTVFSSSNTQLMTVLGDGSVGIGAQAPAALLDVGGWSGKPSDVYGAGASIEGDLFFGNDGSGVGRMRGISNVAQGVLQWNMYYAVTPSAGYRSFDSTRPGFELDMNGSADTITFRRYAPSSGYLSGTPIMTMSNNAGVFEVAVNGKLTATQVIGAVYQDIAEWVPATTQMAAGTVVVLNPAGINEVMPSQRAYDTSVAGVVSDHPGVILGVASDSKEQIATYGRVRVRVDATGAPIRVGDLLVTSDQPGVAMRSAPVEMAGRPFHQPGTIIGKALEPLDGGAGEILVLLSLQ